jgi:hypothetical protein
MAITRLARFDARKLDTIRSGLDRGENDSNHEDTKATKQLAGARRPRNRPSLVLFPASRRSFFFEIFFRRAC